MSNKRNLLDQKKKRKYAYSQFLKSMCKQIHCHWFCCGIQFSDKSKLYYHISSTHIEEINNLIEAAKHVAKIKIQTTDGINGTDYNKEKLYNWKDSFLNVSLKIKNSTVIIPDKYKNGVILLFYKYSIIDNVDDILAWQKSICGSLDLTGKIRISTEGINITVGCDNYVNAIIYINCIKEHPNFCNMADDDFKMSIGDSNHFSSGLKIGIYSEICPMGINPFNLSYKDACEHVSPKMFHEALKEHLKSNKDSESDKIFVDCRNFYESKIGVFEGALDPNIRKFSYWPEFVDKNTQLFKNKTVFMYCTGGIRCERGSAYLAKKELATKIYQLHGGIHKYIEEYEKQESLFHGKLFVFDDRFAISNGIDEVISNCVYCLKKWDNYELCSTKNCRQLVLSCNQCRKLGKSSCCELCKLNNNEQCNCTINRIRVPCLQN